MQKLLAHIDACLLREAWKGHRIDEATNLVKQYCYRDESRPVDLHLRDRSGKSLSVLGVAHAPAVDRVFVLTQQGVAVFTEDLIYITTISLWFDAVAVTFNPIAKCLVLVRVGPEPVSRSIVCMTSPTTFVFHRDEVGARNMELLDTHVDQTTGDVYLLSQGESRYLLTRFSGSTFCQKSSSVSRDVLHLCPHDGSGALLVGARLFGRLDRNLRETMTTKTKFLGVPAFVSWKRDLVLMCFNEVAPIMTSNLQGQLLGFAFTQFTPVAITLSTKGTFYFVNLEPLTLCIAEPAFVLLSLSLNVSCL